MSGQKNQAAAETPFFQIVFPHLFAHPFFCPTYDVLADIVFALFASIHNTLERHASGHDVHPQDRL